MLGRSLFVLASLGLVSAAAMVACSSTPGSDGTDGGVLSDGSISPTLDGATADGGACPPAPTLVVEAQAASLDVSGDSVVFLDLAGGVEFLSTNKTRSIRRIGRDGTGDTALYTAPKDHQINDQRTVGDTVFFLESERNEFGSEATTLFSLPLAGGTPTVLAKHADPEVAGDFNRLDTIAAVDADAVYAIRGGPAVGFGSLWRFARAGGTETVVYRGNVNTKPQKVGADFFFASNDILSNVPNSYSVVKVPASGGALTAVGGAKCRDDLVAGTFGLLCVGASETGESTQVSRWDLSGAGHAVVHAFPEKSSRNATLGPSDGTAVYLHTDVNAGSSADIVKAPLAGGAASVVACGRQRIFRRNVASGANNGAFVSELDMVTAGTELVWVETRKEAGGPEKTGVYRAAR